MVVMLVPLPPTPLHPQLPRNGSGIDVIDNTRTHFSACIVTGAREELTKVISSECEVLGLELVVTDLKWSLDPPFVNKGVYQIRGWVVVSVHDVEQTVFVDLGGEVKAYGWPSTLSLEERSGNYIGLRWADAVADYLKTY
jgi:hypothetical protein